MKTVKRILVFSVALMLVLSACTGGAAPPTPAPSATQPAGGKPSTGPVSGAPAKIKLGIVVLLSGGAAVPFGIPAKNGAEVMIDAINNGKAPAPYNTPGIAGVPITAVYIDESGGADKQIAELKRLFTEEKVDAVIGYISSGDCLAAGPVADELKGLTVVFDCGTKQLFEEKSFKYLFRTNAHQTIDSIGAARYLLKVSPSIKTVAGINQDYSWGQDSWKAFRDALAKLKPDVQFVQEQFPKLGAGDYSAEISALLQAKPEYIHTSFWGADLDGLVIQGTPRNLFSQSTAIMTVGEYALPGLGNKIPKGTIIGAHGAHGPMSPKSDLNDWLIKIYTDKYNVRPTYPVYHMAQAILGVKMAYEKAATQAHKWPTLDQVSKSFEYMEFPSPSGTIKMSIGKGHQAVEDAPFATAGDFDPATKEVKLTNVIQYPAECINPPDGVTTDKWIQDGFPGAKCP